MNPLEMDASHSYLSIITMVAPSPDWFSGVYSFNVLDNEGVFWLESFTLATFPWDAGTDSGITYASSDEATSPQQPIFQLTADTIPETNVFLNPTGDAVEPVAMWTCAVQPATGVVEQPPSVEPSTVPAEMTSAEPIVIPSSNMPIGIGLPNAEPPSAAPSVPDMETSVPTLSSMNTSVATPSPAPSIIDGTGLESSVPTATPAPTSEALPYYVIETVLGSTPSTTNVEVTCTFENEWTSARHPNDYPDDALWSPMVMASHSDRYQMWGSPGVLASDGVKLVAETGNTSALIDEMMKAGTNVLDQKIGPPIMLAENPDQLSLIGPLYMDWTRPYITTISMIAPSPDWFSGFYNFNVIDPKTETWYESFVIQTYPWDAGTDSGSTYLSEDMPIDTPLWIYQLTPETVPPTTRVFLDTEGTTVLPVANWSCKVTAVPGEDTSRAQSISFTWTFRVVPIAFMVLYNLF